MTNNPDPAGSNESESFLGLKLESTVIIAAVAAGCYYISAFFSGIYFSRLGINPSLLHYSFDEILSKGLVMIGISILICLILWMGVSYPGKWHILSWLFSNVPFFLAIGSMIIFIIDPFYYITQLFSYITTGVIIILLVYLLYSFRSKQLLVKLQWEKDLSGKVAVIFLIFFSLTLFSLVLGVDSARKDIECNTGSCVHINLTFKDQNFSSLNSQKLILLTYHDGKYYVSEQKSPSPQHSLILIIPDDQISFVRMKNVDNWSDQNQLNFS